MGSITEEILERQLHAMGSDSYVVAFAGHDGTWLEEKGSYESFLETAGHLQHMNRIGRDIHFRPGDPLRFTFLDDLKADAIGRMKRDGFSPAAIVETSPGNFQAWLKHPAPLPEKRMGTLAARSLAVRYGGDPSAAAFQHPGRLAGFRSWKHEGWWVKLAEAAAKIYPAAGKFLKAVTKDFTELRAKEAELVRHSLQTVEHSQRQLRTIDDYRGYARFNGDMHKADQAWAFYARRNGVSPDEIAAAIATRDLSHKGARQRQEQYIERTIKKAGRFLGR